MKPPRRRYQARPRQALRLWKEAGHSQAKLARLLGRSESAVRHILRGRQQEVSPENVAAYENLFKRYGVPIEGMWELDEDHLSYNDEQRSLREAEYSESNSAAAADDDDNKEEPVLITPRETLDIQTLEYFGLEADPFDHLDFSRIWSDKIRQYLGRQMRQTIISRGILAVAGEVGSGKTTMLRQLMVDLERHDVRFCSPAAIDRSRITEGTLVSSLLRDLGSSDAGYSMASEKRSQQLRELLTEYRQSGVLVVLVIDEAHDLTDRALVALKRIWDSYTTFRLLSIVLAGQLSLHRRLATNLDLRELTLRCTLLELPDLTPEEAYDYVVFRFKTIGADASKVFMPDAFTGLRVGQKAYPLWLNTIAVRAMRKARELGETTITRELIASV